MTLTEEQVAIRVVDAVKGHTMRQPRSQQQAEHRIGASEIGLCRSYLKYMTEGVEYDADKVDRIKWPAFVGSAVGDRVEEAYLDEHPNALTQADFDCTLPSGKVIGCHSDIIDPDLNVLIDIKTKDGIALVQASRQYRYQVAIYLRGAIQAGLLEEGARAFLVYMDRSGGEEIPKAIEVVVDEWLYVEIDEWIDEAMYAVENQLDAPRDMEWPFCESSCPFFLTCRAGQSFSEGLIEGEEVQMALKEHLQAKADAKDAADRKKEADAILKMYAEKGGMVASGDDTYELSLTQINGGPVAYDQKPYTRMNVRKRRS